MRLLLLALFVIIGFTQTTNAELTRPERRLLAKDFGDKHRLCDGKITKLYRLQSAAHISVSEADVADRVVQDLCRDGGLFPGFTASRTVIAGEFFLEPKSADMVIENIDDISAMTARLQAARTHPSVRRANPVFVDPVTGLRAVIRDQINIEIKRDVDPKTYFGNDWTAVEPWPGHTHTLYINRPGHTADQILEEVN